MIHVILALRMLLHKFWVAFFLWKIAFALIWRSIVHDFSKFRWGEFKGHAQRYHELRAAIYGTDEYWKLMEQMKSYNQLHYRRNRHHPEFYADGFAGMSGLDRIEMLCDWQAAVKRSKEGHISRSIKINQKKLLLSDDDCRWLRSFI